MTFTLNQMVLIHIFKKWNVNIPSQRLILFAFRGISPLNNTKTWRKTWQLQKSRLDYKHMRCAIGIWDRSTGLLFIAPGSTVPHSGQVTKAADKNGKGANQLEPGFYTDYRKGEHLEGSPRGHQALRQTGPRFIRRTTEGAPYEKTDRLLFSNPYDNLHCSWNIHPSEAGFSSAGCIVVAGWPHCPRQSAPKPNRGHWRAFHKYLYQAGQTGFPFLLLEAGQIARVLQLRYSRPLLCYGSAGPPVKQLQQRLKRLGFYKGPVNGFLDTRTYRAWNKWGF